MHRIEIDNEKTVFEFVIVEASRDRLYLEHARDIEAVSTDAYVRFAIDLTRAFHELKGVTTLENENGKTILTISFQRGRVEVEAAWAGTTTRFTTDQSYLTKTVRQIGIVE